MKREELSIGNWVYYKSFSDEAIIRIQELHINGVNPSYFNNEPVASIPYSKLYPIPISKEILDINGFVVNTHEKNLYYRDKDLIPYTIVFNPLHNRSWNLMYNVATNNIYIEDDPIIDIKYVHQFQNFLELIGYKKDIIVLKHECDS